MKKKKIIVIGVIMLMMFYLTLGKPVETKEQAIKIAKNHVIIKYWWKNFDEYEICAWDASVEKPIEGEYWIVSYELRSDSGNFVDGGGGPAVWIKKNNGKVVKCKLQA